MAGMAGYTHCYFYTLTITPLTFYSPLSKFRKKLPYLPLCFVHLINKPKTPWQVAAITCHEPAIPPLCVTSQRLSTPGRRCLTWFACAQSQAAASRPQLAWRTVGGGRFLRTNTCIRGRAWRPLPQSPCLGHIGRR